MEPNDAFQLRRSFTVPKHDDGSANEDHSARNRSRGRYALSDGASVSFDSATWSRLLVHRYVVRPDINTIWLRDLIGQFAARFNWDAVSATGTVSAAWRYRQLATHWGCYATGTPC